MPGTKLWMPFLAGFGAGIGTSILVTSEKGQRIRERAGQFARESAQAAKERAKNFGKSAAETLESGAKALRNGASVAVEGAVAKTTQAADEFARKSKSVEHSVGEKLEDAGKRLQEA